MRGPRELTRGDAHPTRVVLVDLCAWGDCAWGEREHAEVALVAHDSGADGRRPPEEIDLQDPR